MSIAIVITLYCIAVLVFGVYMIAKVHLETSRITQEKDLISKIIENRERAIRHSGSAMKINTYFAILGLSPLIVGTIVYLFSKNGLFAILMGFMGFLTPDLILYVIHGQTEKNFEERYARALDQLGSSLRAGISISTAVEDVAQNVLQNCLRIYRWVLLLPMHSNILRMIVETKMLQISPWQLLYKIRSVDMKQTLYCRSQITLKNGS